jgi:hypothetical protein
MGRSNCTRTDPCRTGRKRRRVASQEVVLDVDAEEPQRDLRDGARQLVVLQAQRPDVTSKLHAACYSAYQRRRMTAPPLASSKSASRATLGWYLSAGCCASTGTCGHTRTASQPTAVSVRYGHQLNACVFVEWSPQPLRCSQHQHSPQTCHRAERLWYGAIQEVGAHVQGSADTIPRTSRRSDAQTSPCVTVAHVQHHATHVKPFSDKQPVACKIVRQTCKNGSCRGCLSAPAAARCALRRRPHTHRRVAVVVSVCVPRMPRGGGPAVCAAPVWRDGGDPHAHACPVPARRS